MKEIKRTSSHAFNSTADLRAGVTDDEFIPVDASGLSGAATTSPH